MKLYIYQGLDKERVPRDVTHAIVDDSVTIIKEGAFQGCTHLISIIMGDNVKRIEMCAFFCCYALRYIRLSTTLEYIGSSAFSRCDCLQALSLPSTVNTIGDGALTSCRELRLLILPDLIDRSNMGNWIVGHIDSALLQIAENVGVVYEYQAGYFTRESISRVDEWLLHHMDHAPFHKVCYNPSVTTNQINDYLSQNGNDSALAIDAAHGMTPLHVISMNTHAPGETIAALFNSQTDTIFCEDNQQNTPLDYARDYNIGGLIEMITELCIHRHSSTPVEEDTIFYETGEEKES